MCMVIDPNLPSRTINHRISSFSQNAPIFSNQNIISIKEV